MNTDVRFFGRGNDVRGEKIIIITNVYAATIVPTILSDFSADPELRAVRSSANNRSLLFRHFDDLDDDRTINDEATLEKKSPANNCSRLETRNEGERK